MVWREWDSAYRLASLQSWFEAHWTPLVRTEKADLSGSSGHRFGDWQWWYCPGGLLEGIGRGLDVDRYWNDEEVGRGHGKEDKSSYSCGGMVYKILKIEYRVENIANDVCNHGTEFESFPAIMSWLVVDWIRGVKFWWDTGLQTFDLVLYIGPKE